MTLLITDLTRGSSRKMLWMFSIPMLLSVAFQQVYQIADSIIAGQFIGEAALAAVGASHPITMIFMAVAVGSNIGCAVVVSRLFGAKKYSALKTAICTIFCACIAVSVVLTLVGIFGGSAMLRLIRTPADVFADAKLYLHIYIYGFLFLYLYNICNGIFTSLGDSRTPLYFLIGSSISNILLDIFFVVWLKMGVAGVAWATFLCQGISCILAMVVIFRRLAKIEGKEKAPFFDKKILMQIVVIAVPSTLQQSFISLGNIVIQSIINGFGAPVMAGYSAAVKLNNLVITSFTTLGNGISNYAAQNLGARKMPRIKEGFRAGVKMVWMLSLPLFLLYFFGGNIVLKLFMDEPTELAMHTGIIYLKILSPFYFVVSAKLVADGILRGAGLMKNFMVATFTDLILRVVLAFVFSKTALGATGIWCAWPVGWCVATTLSIMFYRRGPWKNGQTAAESSVEMNVD